MRHGISSCSRQSQRCGGYMWLIQIRILFPTGLYEYCRLCTSYIQRACTGRQNGVILRLVIFASRRCQTMAAEPQPIRPGHWTRVRGCTFSATCQQCRDGPDTQQSAIRRQHAAAAAALSTAEAPRRVVVTFTGDMKGLMQICGHAGPAGVYFCVFCLMNEAGRKGVRSPVS